MEHEDLIVACRGDARMRLQRLAACLPIHDACREQATQRLSGSKPALQGGGCATYSVGRRTLRKATRWTRSGSTRRSDIGTSCGPQVRDGFTKLQAPLGSFRSTSLDVLSDWKNPKGQTTMNLHIHKGKSRANCFHSAAYQDVSGRARARERIRSAPARCAFLIVGRRERESSRRAPSPQGLSRISGAFPLRGPLPEIPRCLAGRSLRVAGRRARRPMDERQDWTEHRMRRSTRSKTAGSLQTRGRLAI